MGLSYFQLGLFSEAEALFDRVLAMPDAGNLALIYATYYKCLLFLETRRIDEARTMAAELAKDAMVANDFVMLWCARLHIAEACIALDKRDEAQSVLDELGETNAFLPFLKARFASIRSEICRRNGDFSDAVRLAAEAVATGKAGPRYNYGEDPLQLRYALALHAFGDEGGARDAIRVARDDLQERAAKIPDMTLRQTYLENIAAHARTFELAQKCLAT